MHKVVPCQLVLAYNRCCYQMPSIGYQRLGKAKVQIRPRLCSPPRRDTILRSAEPIVGSSEDNRTLSQSQDDVLQTTSHFITHFSVRSGRQPIFVDEEPEKTEWFPLLEEISTGPDPSVRLDALLILLVTEVGGVEPRDRDRVVTAFKEAISLVQRNFISQPSVRSQRNMIGNNSFAASTSVPFHAASRAIVWGDVRLAVEFLEYGRSLVWSRMRGLRTAKHSLEGSAKTCMTDSLTSVSNWKGSSP